MAIWKADKTLKAIESALKADQGARYRGLLRDSIAACSDAFDPQESSPFRSHLGISLIGRDCPRQLWYNFRWVKSTTHIGRMVRLFNRGHLEEGRFVALLQMIGCAVWQVDSNGKQFRVSWFGGHFGSAIDAVIKNCPDVPDEAILAEFKTYNDKSFQKLKKEGVRSAKFEHFVQQQLYMADKNLRHSLYLAINKNDDELYGEIVEYDLETVNRYYERGGMIVFAKEPPTKINNSSSFFTCKMCDFREICHKGEHPARNCRTCNFSVPLNDGTWGCTGWNKILTKEDQLAGCEHWHPMDSLNDPETSPLPDVCQE